MADDSPDNMKTLISLGSVIAALLAIFVDPFWHVDLPPVRGTPSVEWTPRTLAQCFIVLDKELPADTLQRMRTISEADMIEYHFGLGTWMRDSWGLWSGGPLYSYFRQMGLEHPDDMSGVILTSFWRHLHGKRLDVAFHGLHDGVCKCIAAAGRYPPKIDIKLDLHIKGAHGWIRSRSSSR